MRIGLDSLSISKDHRGNRLSESKLFVSESGKTYQLYLRAYPEICSQVHEYLASFGATSLFPERPGDRTRWTAAYRFGAPKPPGLKGLREVLGEVLTLVPVEGTDAALALDFYKQPNDDGELENTKAGECIYRLKYWKSRPDARIAAGRVLAGWMADVIRRHPLLARADRVVIVPSTDSGVSEILGEAVAKRIHMPFVVAVETTGSRELDKAGGDGPPKEYRVDRNLRGETVLVIDDVCWHGRALRGVARAAREAGASKVYALVGARNLRS